jgi:hypothetical protein
MNPARLQEKLINDKLLNILYVIRIFTISILRKKFNVVNTRILKPLHPCCHPVVTLMFNDSNSCGIHNFIYFYY